MRGYSVGAVDFLFKPIVPEILKGKVTAFIDLFQKTEAIKRQARQLVAAEERMAEQRLAEQRQRWEADRLREEVAREKRRGEELERLERDRRGSEERFRSLVTATSQIVWTAAADGQFTTEQPNWSLFTGQTFEQLRGRGWLDAVHPEEREQTSRVWRRAVQTRSLYEIEHRLRRGDGTYVPMSVRAAPVLEHDGAIREWVGAHADITARRRAEEELLHAKDAAEVANRAKSQFLANMSHELRTPLNAVIGYSEMLQEECEELGVKQLIPELGRIRAAGKHLLALVNDILDLSKVEAGRMELFVETFDVAAAVGDVAVTVQPLVEKNGNTLEVRCAADAGTMHADLTKVRQGLFNLLSNAAKFTRNGSITLDVTRSAGQGGAAGGFVEFRVRDTGIGMTPEQMGRLFEPFMQADASTTREYGGTGLGLSITRKFCQMMGGDVLADSRSGEGSTFTMRLPAEVPQPAADAPPGANASGAAIGPRPADGAPTILVVDDDADARALAARLLTNEGYRVVTASDGPEGLRLAREHRPLAITLDVLMPQMDGWAVLTSLKSAPELADIPVIMVTMTGDRNLGFALGASDFMTKPIDRGRLLSVLRRYACQAMPCRVLVVDDDPASRDVLRPVLEAEGWAVDVAADGEEGLRRVAEAPPDLILLDLMMPGINGFEVAAELHRNEAWRSIPVVVMTAKDLTDEDRQRLNGLVARVLQKGGDGTNGLRAVRDITDITSTCPAAQRRVVKHRSVGRHRVNAAGSGGENETWRRSCSSTTANPTATCRARGCGRGHEVLQAADGQQAVEMTRHDGPDLVLMDLNLPVLDGWTATRQIKAFPARGRLPVIALTTARDERRPAEGPPGRLRRLRHEAGRPSSAARQDRRVNRTDRSVAGGTAAPRRGTRCRFFAARRCRCRRYAVTAPARDAAPDAAPTPDVVAEPISLAVGIADDGLSEYD